MLQLGPIHAPALIGGAVLGVAIVWVAAAQDLVVVTIGVLGGFLVMWVVLAAITMSRGL